jgi:hypothetical protein
VLQVAVGDEAAGEEVQPDGLAVVFECFDGIHDACFSSSGRSAGSSIRRDADLSTIGGRDGRQQKHMRPQSGNAYGEGSILPPSGPDFA